MELSQLVYENNEWRLLTEKEVTDASLLLCFGSRKLLEDAHHYQTLKKRYTQAHILMCTTAGEIYENTVSDETIVATAMSFAHTPIEVAQTPIQVHADSTHAGKHLASLLPKEGLSYVLLVSDGGQVNGSDLVAAFTGEIGENVIVTGGLAGDGALFEKTLVGLDAAPSEGTIAAIGLYGKNIQIGHGSVGGWDVFGPERMVTRSEGNVLFEIDDENALDLYKNYLGKYASELPGAALLFPLSISDNENPEGLVRTILSINEEKKTMIFAGNIPEGSMVRLMKANFDRLIDGALHAAEDTLTSFDNQPQFAILISCVGRKLVLGQRVEEEIESVREILGNNTLFAGFYSYGEISPFMKTQKCALFNQTMTITTFNEK